ncbi:probable disease resistance protein At5g45490 [Eucalyptus grandis]|uniref:probable disease resistance protein At5g45490 n=1 Tax=Eucalyptus grandis TaxID=71139 RepID=UPI000526D25E|nr:probable disease resistance protein At5g45490 [Eucalyptus grandis]
MEETIEKYLTEKFRTKLHNGPRVRFYRRFAELESLLDKIKASDSPTRRSVKEQLYCLNNVLEECQVLARKKSLSLPTVLSPSKFQISRTLDKIKQQLHQVDRSIASSQETFCVLPQNLEASRGSSTWVDPSRVHGFDNEVVNLKTKLLRPGKPSDQAIAIIGTSGVGKTTLAQLVYNKQEVKSHFLPRIWVSLSPQPNEAENTREAIAKKLLTRLGVETDIISSIDSHGFRGLLYALHLQLLGKRYLIVLDDVRDTNPWHDVWDGPDGLPKGNGGSVVITSRAEKVTNTMDGEDNVIRLQPLTDPESCWCIFRDEVEKDGEKLNDDEIRKLKPAVTKKSAGLPLAAKVMGEIFYEKRKAKEVVEHGEIHPQES